MVGSDGNTVNPTKSPCDPYVFNTVLTRSKSLIVVVGSPVALLGIEEHMEKLYGRRAQCWSSFLRLCLKNNTFFIPPKVEPLSSRALEEFKWRLKSKLFDGELIDSFIKLHESHKFEYMSCNSVKLGRKQESMVAPEVVEKHDTAISVKKKEGIVKSNEGKE